MSRSEGAAAQRWREGLESWAIPPAILDAAPRSPYGFSVGLFEKAADRLAQAPTPTIWAARDALPAAGSVLDVGCGPGAASMPLADIADLLLGVDESEDMLAAYVERVAGRVRVETFAGRWPDVAGEVPPADVVVCRNVAYNVPDLGPFAEALSRHAHRRVVLELTELHPLSWTAPYWRELHGLERPARPTLDEALAVLDEVGLPVEVERWETDWLLAEEPPDVLVDFLLRRLCLPDERATDVAGLLLVYPPPKAQPTATIWWPDTA